MYGAAFASPSQTCVKCARTKVQDLARRVLLEKVALHTHTHARTHTHTHVAALPEQPPGLLRLSYTEAFAVQEVNRLESLVARRACSHGVIWWVELFQNLAIM